jgi:exonuclease SbcD
LKIFHTADVHLGLKFGSYPEGLSRRLADARFETLARMVEIANQRKCDLFVVGGDLFDNLRVSQKDIIRAAKILGAFEKLAVVLPGNHDFITNQEDDIWKVFQSAGQDRVLVLAEARSYSFAAYDIDATLYAAPCQNKHSKTNAVGWIKTSARGSTKFHIGLAHGSFEGLTPDTEGEYFPMTREDLLPCNLDLWLMGHIHIQFPLKPGSNDRIFYPATPEPDGFDCRHEGKAWILEIDDDKAITSISLSTGSQRFHHETLRVEKIADMDQLISRIPESAAASMLLKLQLTGSLPKAEHELVGATLDRLKARFLHFQADASALTVELAPADIDREFMRDSFPHGLLTALAKQPEDREALQSAYELLRELK